MYFVLGAFGLQLGLWAYATSLIMKSLLSMSAHFCRGRMSLQFVPNQALASPNPHPLPPNRLDLEAHMSEIPAAGTNCSQAVLGY